MAEITVICPLPKGEDLFGMVLGKLRVLGFAGSIKQPGKVPVKKWICLCECGNISVATHAALKAGSTNSCGCVRAAHQWRCSYKHGLHGHPLYKVWQGMKSRCLSLTNRSYPDYGGRGIIMSDHWMAGFQAFYDDMKHGYRAGLSIERMDNNGPYSKENCRWATRVEQQNNLRRNNRLTVGGETHTVAEWARITGIKPTTIYGRIRSGWRPDSVIRSTSSSLLPVDVDFE